MAMNCQSIDLCRYVRLLLQCSFAGILAVAPLSAEFANESIPLRSPVVVTSDTAAASDTVPLPMSADSAAHKASIQTGKPDTTDTDSVGALWHSPYWSIGIGWTLGDLPIFTEWSQQLVDTIRMLNLPDSLVARLRGTLAISKAVDQYSAAFPVAIRFTPYISPSTRLSFEADGYVVLNDFLATVSSVSVADTTLRDTFEINQTFTFATIALGARWQYDIPPEYFSISGVAGTSFFCGLYCSPLVYLNAHASLNRTARYDTSFAIFEQRAADLLQTGVFFGGGAGWKLGIESRINLAQRGGAIAGIAYSGQWYDYFYRNGSRAHFSDINALSVRGGENMALICHRVELFVQVVLTGPEH